jgi:hypothetical protein
MPPAHHGELATGARVAHDGRRIVGETPGIGGRLPTYRFITRKRSMMAAWFVVML